MTEKSDKIGTVSFDELLIAQMIQIDAISQLLKDSSRKTNFIRS